MIIPIPLFFIPPVEASPAAARTPIKHVVVIFQENVSFDHYFATYPNALNKPGETPFKPLKGTPSVNGLTGALLTRNPNSAAPVRLSPAQAATCDQDHEYASEQKAFHGGLMDRFVESTGASENGCDPKIVMDYYDGNTVAAMWNYAQHFAMSDNSYGTTFGPSTVGAINLVSGQTHGALPPDLSENKESFTTNGTLIGDPDPKFDDCSKGAVVEMRGVNIGDLLNRRGLTWGWFEGGFRPSQTADGKAVCGSSHTGSNGKEKKDYIPHHEPFQYYEGTSNPHHLPRTSIAKIGSGDRANHQYDLEDFWDAARAGNIPAVSFLKAKAFEDGHAGYSDPLHEQSFLAETINRLEKLPQWKDSAIFIAYDDSDGWYDHAMGPIISRSAQAGADELLGAGSCGTPGSGAYPARCGYGPRLPLLVVSPYARTNFVDHSVTDQTSIIRFIEDNWELGRIGDQSFDELAGPLDQLFDFQRAPKAAPLFLDPATGLPQTKQ